MNCTCFGKGHPLREQKPCSFARLADDQVAGATMLFVANNDHGLADERVKGVGDHHLKRQIPGIMTPLGEGRMSGEAIDTRTRSIRRGSGHGTSER